MSLKKREKKSARMKRELYEAAMELFRRKGFNETTVDEIAERAGLSRATFFNYFGTKQGVLRLYGQRLQEIVESILECAARSASPLELIRRMVLAMVHEAEENIEEVRIVCTNSLLDPSYISNPTPARRRVFEVLVGLVSDAQREGEIRTDLPAEDIALHIFSLYQGMILAGVVGLDNCESLKYSGWQFILTGVINDGSQS